MKIISQLKKKLQIITFFFFFTTNNIFKQFQSFTTNIMAIELLEHIHKRTYTIIIIICIKPFGKLKIMYYHKN